MKHQRNQVASPIEAALQHHRAGRLQQAEAIYKKFPYNPDALHLRGMIAHQLNNNEEAVALIGKAIQARPAHAAYYFSLEPAYRALNRLNDVVAAYERLLERAPENAAAYNNLGNALNDQGRQDDAEACYRKALALEPNFAEAHANLGILLTARGKREQAAACFQKAVAIKPDFAGAHNDLGVAYTHLGKLDQAVECYRTALALKPDFAEAHHNLGCALKDQARLDEAIVCYRNALALRPHFVEAHNDLGITFGHQGKLDEAIACYQAALAIQPNHGAVHNNLGIALHRKGRPDDAIACYRKAIECQPDFVVAHNALLLEMQYAGTCSPEQMFDDHLRFAERFEAPLKPLWRAHSNSRDPHKRLKIGYVSPDFQKHSVAYFIEPALTCHDKTQVEVFCYYNHDHYDAVTYRLQALADHWVPCKRLSDDQLAERIRADGIDILIDLAGHTGGNRLLTFARKPAPVQVTYLGYPATTGLSAIDYRITDIHAEPPGMTEHLNAEQLWRLPDSFYCYRAQDNSPQVIDHPPSEDNGYVTFGCFNNFSKVGDPVLALWARLLQQVPSARLMLEIHGIDQPDYRAEVESRFARLGLPPERVIFIPRRPENQYVLYNRIDIALDPFPCNGGTTSLDTVWMGVPFVTLAGSYFTARMGVTILTNAGMPELIAASEDEYVDIAAGLAQDPARLKALRAGLRERVKISPLMDAQRFTAHLEQAYRGMWQAWCGNEIGRCDSAPVPDDAASCNDAGNALKAQGRLDEAVTCYRKALALDPKFTAAHYNLGIALQHQARLDDALTCYLAALGLKPDFTEAHNNLGLVFAAQGKLDEAVECYQTALLLKPDFAEAHNNLGSAFRAQSRSNEAVTSYLNALALKVDFIEVYNNLGLAFADQGKLAEAIDCYQTALLLKPDYAQAHHNLGIAFYHQRRLDDAIACYRNALAHQSGDANTYNNLGSAFSVQGKPDDALACYRQALALQPDFAQAHANLGNVLADQGKLDDAIDCYRKALAIDPDFAIAHNNLGNAFREQGRLDDAMACYLDAIAIKPDYAESYNNLGAVCKEQEKLDDAVVCYQTALTLAPGYAEAHSNLGNALKDLGRLDEAVACYQAALECQPDHANAHHSLLLALQYSASHAPEEMFAAHLRFGAQFETRFKSHWAAHPNPRDPNKRLKIGYVSPDFRKHAVAYFIEPVLACHDKSQVEVFCYYSHSVSDPVSARLQQLADHWVPCKHLSDEQLAERIRADGIDILVDLAGHTGGNRLLAFARKPAPVQVTYLGYPATTGLSAIDYRITDIHAEPPGMTEHLNVEQLWRLPESFCCYRAHDNSPAVIDHPPADDNGYITFGCFNNFSKLTDPVLALWARLLQQVPSARLMLEIRGIDNPAFLAEVEQRLTRIGLPLERIILLPRKPENQYVLYNRIDIALDPFPCNGGTTSLDTVWMGVPFVTLAGSYFTSRMGVTILTNAGMPELIAHTEDDYLRIAAGLAQDLARLKALRAGLRERVQASPLMDAPRFTAHLEQAYRAMWQAWCTKDPA